MLTGDNGLLTKANMATEEHSHASVREGIILAYNEYQTELKTLAEDTQTKGDVKLASTKATKIAELKITKNTSFIEFLEVKDYLDTNGKVKTQELLGGKTKLGNGSGKSDVYIVSLDEEEDKYILTYYEDSETSVPLWDVDANRNPVKINISKTPETKKVSSVLLQVTSVDGFTQKTFESREQLEEVIHEMDEDTKKKIGEWIMLDRLYPEYDSIQQVVDAAGRLGLAWNKWKTDNDFWNSYLKEKNGLTSLGFDVWNQLEKVYTDSIKSYIIVNPNNKTSRQYVANENDFYTFEIFDILTGNIYSKKVEVSNITTEKEYYINIKDNEYKVSLSNVESNLDTTFEEAHILYKGKKINVISAKIDEGNGYLDIRQITEVVAESLGISTWDVMQGRDTVLMIIKDKIEYISNINLSDGGEY